VGSRFIQELGLSQRKEMEKQVMQALRANFKPEFLNRIDETIIFHNLTPEQLVKIVDIQLKRLSSRLVDKNIALIVSETAKSLLAEKGYDPVYGARPLKRVIQKYLENPLSIKILKGDLPEGARVNAEADGERIVFRNV
jgi:ATP-dependent Clp protease ATP-binding subunit ClpB